MDEFARRYGLALIAAVGLAILVPSLFTRDPWNPDEPRYAEVAREMVSLPNYLVPHLNGEPYPDKPPVFFWLAAGFWHLGFEASSGRMVALLATLGTAAVVYALGRRLHSPETGLLAALITLTTLLFVFICKFGVIDPLLTLFTTMAVYCAVRAFEPGCGSWWLGFYAAGALAILTKGPVGLMVPGLVALCYGFVRRRELHKGGWWHLAGAALLLALVAAWLVPACLCGGKEYRDNILFHQTASRIEGFAPHRQPIYFYLLYSPAYVFPWSLVLVLAVASAVAAARSRREAGGTLASAWLIAPFIIFTLFPVKRERYLLPLVPAVGLLCARYVVAIARGEATLPQWHARLWKATFVLVGLIAIVLGAATLSPDTVVKRFDKDPALAAEIRSALTPGLVAGAAVGGLLMLAACFYGIRQPRLGDGERRRVAALAAAALVLSLLVDLAATPVLDRVKSGRDLVEQAGPYLKEPYEVILYQSNYSGVYNLFARRTRMRVIKDKKDGEKSAEQRLIEALRSDRPVAVIAMETREASAEDLAAKLRAHEVARERVGHSKIVVLVNRK